MEKGDILGHEFMGEVVEIGPRRQEPEGRRPGRRPVPDRLRQLLRRASRSCSRCARTPTRTPGWPRSCGATRPAGIFGYSHLLGGYAGGQAEYARVPFADVGPIKVPDGLHRRAGAVPLGHLPDRLHGRGDVRHQAGRRRSPSGAAGPVGQFAIASAYLLGAERVIAIDRFPYRLRMAARTGRRARRSTTRRSDVLERAQGDDRRPRPRRLHRRRRHGGARRTADRTPTTAPSRR